MTYARVVIVLGLYSLEQCLNPVLRTSIKTHNFVTFYKFLIHIGVHHTKDVGPQGAIVSYKDRGDADFTGRGGSFQLW
jgi:hypothetical protein